jgi:hypothetical protein
MTLDFDAASRSVCLVARLQDDDATVVGSGCDDQFEFEFAIDVILDGLERLRRREAGRS